MPALKGRAIPQEKAKNISKVSQKISGCGE
jgi:hypothetical protein